MGQTLNLHIYLTHDLAVSLSRGAQYAELASICVSDRVLLVFLAE